MQERSLRQIKTWTAFHAFRRELPENCAACNEPIRWGTYKREVWIASHPRYGDLFVILRFHEDPECDTLREDGFSFN